MSCGYPREYEPEQVVLRNATSEDIKGQYVICVDGREIRRNEEREVDDQQPVFLISHKGNLSSWLTVREAKFENGKMVHSPRIPLEGANGNDVVAWVEVDGPIKVTDEWGYEFVLQPESGLELNEVEQYQVVKEKVEEKAEQLNYQLRLDVD